MASNNPFGTGPLFSPSIVRRLASENVAFKDMTIDNMSQSLLSPTASFMHDPPGSPLKSTQQVSLDWSKFENHTFFNSAEANVNVAFDTIINYYPFDGTKRELDKFRNDLTGFEKYILDRFPKNLGYLNFSGTVSGESSNAGTFIRINDYAGTTMPTLSRDRTGKSILDAGVNSLSFDFHLSIPKNIDLGHSVLVQRVKDKKYGFTLVVSETNAAAVSGAIEVIVSSGSHFMSASMDLARGRFQHICATINNTPGIQKIELYRNFKLKSTSSMSTEMGAFGYADQPMFIGSGTAHGPYGASEGTTWVPTTSFSGSIDDFRIFHSARTPKIQEREAHRNVYPSKKLKLYFKFNEPTGSYSNNSILIDSSGNSLHSNITNYSSALRELDTSGIENAGRTPLVLESLSENPVLFPAHPELISLNQDLLTSASRYDYNNPNLITKLVPKHYLHEALQNEGFDFPDPEIGSVGNVYGESKNFPGGGQLSPPHLMATLLFIWAKQFDELKIYLDHFGRMLHVDYDDNGTVADTFLPFLAEYYGFSLPNMTAHASLGQYNNGENLRPASELHDNSLKYVQNQIWRRILTDLSEIIKSKGTIHSIKSLIRRMGINPDQNFRFREFGGSKSRKITDVREARITTTRMISFSGSQAVVTEDLNSHGISTNKPFAQSCFLSGARVEVGKPDPAPYLQSIGYITSSDYSKITEGDKFFITSSDGQRLTFIFAANAPAGTSGSIETCTIKIAGTNNNQAQEIYEVITSSFSGSVGGTYDSDLVTVIQSSRERLNLGNNAFISGTHSPDTAAISFQDFSGGSGFIKPHPNKDKFGNHRDPQASPKAPKSVQPYGIHGVSARESDGLFTSGSWTYEAYYAFPARTGSLSYNVTQSLSRVCTTGSAGSITGSGAILANLIAFSGSSDNLSTGSLTLYVRPVISGSMLALPVTGVNIFDGNNWHISFGRIRSDLTGTINSSSYFLRAGRASSDGIEEYHSKSILFDDHDGTNYFESLHSSYNASGSFFVIGSQSIDAYNPNATAGGFLNDTNKNIRPRWTLFEGNVGQIRFWSKDLNDTEDMEHVRNFKSLGVSNPKKNFNFVSVESGSFERLRVDISADQIRTGSNSSGFISFFDFSQNNLHLSGTGFEANKPACVPVTFQHSMISPYFDQAINNQKIRPRSFKNSETARRNKVEQAPLHKIPPGEISRDDKRFSIEVSSVQALNEDIINIFSTLDSLDEIIGSPNLVFSLDYPDLEILRDIYFQRLTTKINNRAFFEFFKWFDSTISDMIEKLVPRKTRFLGVNFVIESHMLERPKFTYNYSDIYLGENDRHSLKGTLLLRQLVATIRKY